MPADTSAKRYTWYMSDDPAARIVAFEWWPVAGVIESSMTFGKMTLKTRDDPDDVWSAGKLVGEMPWVVAQSLAREQGFNVEVAYHG